MKTFLKILFATIALCLTAATAKADNNEKYFDKIGGKSGFSYSYISPLMLKAMADQYMSDKAYGSLPIRTSSLNMIESLSTATEGRTKSFGKPSARSRRIKNWKRFPLKNRITTATICSRAFPATRSISPTLWSSPKTVAKPSTWYTWRAKSL